MSNLTALLNKYKALVIFDTETSGLDFDKDQIIDCLLYTSDAADE